MFLEQKLRFIIESVDELDYQVQLAHHRFLGISPLFF